MVDQRDIDRFSNMVPSDLTTRSEIRDWFDEKAGYLPPLGRNKLANNIEQNRVTEPTSLPDQLEPEGGFEYDTDAGMWREKGRFISGDLPEGAYYDEELEQWRGPNGQFVSGPKVE